jgi:hypothetical protein
MTKWTRGSESHYLANLARKARRRGDAAEATRWLKAVAIRQAEINRFDAAIQREIEFEQDQVARELALKKAYMHTPEYQERIMREAWARQDAWYGVNNTDPKSADEPPGD